MARRLVLPAAVGWEKLRKRFSDEPSSVLMRVDTGIYYPLRGVANRILELSQRGYSLEAIAGELASDYDMPQSLIKKDLEGFVGELQEKGLAEIEVSQRD